MKRFLVISLSVLFILIAICGCEISPNSDFIVNKKKSYDNLLISNPDEGIYSAPKKWVEKIESKNVLYQIDADIIVPEVNKFPVTQVIPQYFDFKLVDGIFEAFCPSGEIRAERLDVATKAQIQQELNAIIKSIENVDINYPEFSEDDKADYIQSRQVDLEETQARYNAAPDSIDSTVVESSSDITSLDVPHSGRVYVNNKALLAFSLDYAKENDRTAILTVYPAGSLNLKNMGLEETCFMPIPKVEMSKEKVGDVATQFIELIGLTNDYILNKVYSDLAFYDGMVAVFTKEYNGVSINFALPNITANKAQEDPYAQYWRSEQICVFVDPNYNICRLIWQSPSVATKTINENVKLLPFETIQDMVQTNISYLQPDMPLWKNVRHRTIVINRMELGMMRINKLDATDEYIVIPVWDCYGYIIDQYDSQSDSEFVLNKDNNAVIDEYDGVGTFLTLSAVDGSIIDRKLGY